MKLFSPKFFAAHFCAPLSLLPLFAANVHAGGVVATQIDARARWVAHVDLDALHETQLFKALLEADEEKEIEQGLNLLLVAEGIDLFRDVHGATIYGTGPSDDGAVILIAATSAIEPALARWRERLGAKGIDVGGHGCFQWTNDDGPGCSFLQSDKDSNARLLVLAKTTETLGRAIEVLDGKRASFAREAPAELSLQTAPGTFAFAAATGIFDQIAGLATEGPQSTIARLAQGLRFEIGEQRGRIFLDAHLRAKADEDATRVHQILQGLLALVSFAGGEDPDVGATLGRWVKALEITRTGPVVGLHFEYDLVILIREARALDELEKEKKAERREERESKDKK